jgi:NTP pyrophosphatase (non-canonical NTP hydrolase)
MNREETDLPPATTPVQLTRRPAGEKLRELIANQVKFQRMAGVIDVEDASHRERLAASEFFVYKAMEELFELRRTFPSTMNRWAKNQPGIDKTQMKMELSDALLFLINFTVVNDIEVEEVLDMMMCVQQTNFLKLREKLRKLADDGPSEETQI